MIEVIKGFYRHSTEKSYFKGEKISFDAKTETRLIKEGLAKKVVKKKSK